MCYFVLVFFSPFSIAITSLGEETANLSAFHTFVRFVLVWLCRYPLPLGVWEGLWFVIVALSGLFSYLFYLALKENNWLNLGANPLHLEYMNFQYKLCVQENKQEAISVNNGGQYIKCNQSTWREKPSKLKSISCIHRSRPLQETTMIPLYRNIFK